jgi:hypothetical protein
MNENIVIYRPNTLATCQPNFRSALQKMRVFALKEHTVFWKNVSLSRNVTFQALRNLLRVIVVLHMVHLLEILHPCVRFFVLQLHDATIYSVYQHVLALLLLQLVVQAILCVGRARVVSG